MPKHAVVGWIQGGLVPGYHAGRSWLLDNVVYEEVCSILDQGSTSVTVAWPLGRDRTRWAREAIEREMLARRGVDYSVRSYRHHINSGPIYWVPGPSSRVRRRNEYLDE